jgi:hypothetical protein
MRIRFRRLTANKIFVSRAEMKHTNNKVIISLYLYNREKLYFIRKLKNFIRILRKKNSYLFKRKINFISLKGFIVRNKVRKEKKLLFKTLN